MIKALFFGPVADMVGQREIDVDYQSGATLGQLREDLAARYPQAFALVAFVALNGRQERDMSRRLADGDEIAFMAKFSGG